MNTAGITGNGHTTAASNDPNEMCYGFIVVDDNIDKNIRPSFQRENHQTQSLHYFHSYTARNRVDI